MLSNEMIAACHAELVQQVEDYLTLRRQLERVWLDAEFRYNLLAVHAEFLNAHGRPVSLPKAVHRVSQRAKRKPVADTPEGQS